jgi:AraC-like DNA-binding protein
VLITWLGPEDCSSFRASREWFRGDAHYTRPDGGPEWRPDIVSHHACAPIRYGESATTIEYPHRMADSVYLHPGEDQKPLPEEFTELVRLVLEFLLRQGNADVVNLVALIGTSRRTLQRHLLERGKTFSELLDRVRLDMARRLLEDSSIKVIDVAYALGYSDPSHFSRAFRRWTELTPSAWRVARNADRVLPDRRH